MSTAPQFSMPLTRCSCVPLPLPGMGTGMLGAGEVPHTHTVPSAPQGPGGSCSISAELGCGVVHGGLSRCWRCRVGRGPWASICCLLGTIFCHLVPKVGDPDAPPVSSPRQAPCVGGTRWTQAGEERTPGQRVRARRLGAVAPPWLLLYPRPQGSSIGLETSADESCSKLGGKFLHPGGIKKKSKRVLLDRGGPGPLVCPNGDAPAPTPRPAAFQNGNATVTHKPRSPPQSAPAGPPQPQRAGREVSGMESPPLSSGQGDPPAASPCSANPTFPSSEPSLSCGGRSCLQPRFPHLSTRTGSRGGSPHPHPQRQGWAGSAKGTAAPPKADPHKGVSRTFLQLCRAATQTLVHSFSCLTEAIRSAPLYSRVSCTHTPPPAHKSHTQVIRIHTDTETIHRHSKTHKPHRHNTE